MLRFTDIVHLFDPFNRRLRFYCTIDRSSPVNCTVYQLLQQPIMIAPLERVYDHFLNIYCTILKGNDRTGDIRFSWLDVTTDAKSPFSSNSAAKQNDGVFELCPRFRRGTKNEGFIRTQAVFRRRISNNT